MRRPGQYGDSSGHGFVGEQMQPMSPLSGQRMEHKPGHFQGRPEPLASNKEHPYASSRGEGQWIREKDGSSHTYEGQGGDASRSYYQGQRSDPRMALEKQGNNDRRSQPREEDMEIGYEDSHSSQTFEGVEKRFFDDIMKLAKDQDDMEDAENARHKQKIDSINTQYEEQLAALRVRHTTKRAEFLKKESHTRHQQYEKATMDHHPNSGVGPTDPRRYGPTGEQERAYSAEQMDSYSERARFLGGNRDHGTEPNKRQYPGGRVYDTGARYY